jgi:opacity protein-like surface antigen
LSGNAFGWLAGLGTEWMIIKNRTASIEYNYLDIDEVGLS